jgi:hypothetical protein
MYDCYKHRSPGPGCRTCEREYAEEAASRLRGAVASPAAENTAGTKVDATLAERGNRYGDFTDHAKIAEALHGILAGDTPAGKFNTSWGVMQPFQRQALRVIVDKIARILNGDPNYVDNWHDIQGYAKLVEDRLK